MSPFYSFTDVKGPPTHRLSCGQSPYTETTTWERKYCILMDSQLVLLNREKEVRHTVGDKGISPFECICKTAREPFSSSLIKGVMAVVQWIVQEKL